MPNYLTDPTKRGEMMSKIRATNTAPELIVFAELRKRGITFQRHYKRAPGTPDIAKPRKKLAVFIDGDFWHGRELERIRQTHGLGSAWVVKLERNVARDRQRELELQAKGWLVLRVWESDVRRVSTRTETIQRIAAFLTTESDQPASPTSSPPAPPPPPHQQPLPPGRGTSTGR